MRTLSSFHLFIRIYTGLLLFASCTSGVSINNDPPDMWGNLTQGPYPVGFQTDFHHDRTMSPVPFTDWESNVHPTTETEGRQMQINIWYPAKRTGGSSRLNYGHYVDLLGLQTDFGAMNEERRTFANQLFVSQTNALGGGGSFNQEKLDTLRSMTTHALDKASALDGSFPLVVFPNGSSPAIHSIMCEFLASHGFVVAGMALKGEDGFSNEASTKGIEMAVMDLHFAIQQLVKLPNVDETKIGLMANAITSSQITAYHSRYSNVECLVSLEGGLISRFEQGLLDKTVFYEPASIDIPILALYAPHPSIDPSFIYHLKYSDRYFYHFPQMTEFHALNYGQFERIIPGIIGDADPGIQLGYETMCDIVLQFFDSELRKDEGSDGPSVNIPSYAALEAVDTSFAMSAVPVPPSLSVMKSLYKSKGFDAIDSVYMTHKNLDPQPFSPSFYTDMKDWLSWNGDDSYANRFRLYQLACDSYPESAETNFYLGYYSLMTDRLELCKRHYAITRRILSDGSDEDITLGRKSRIENYIIEDLNSMEND